MTKHQLQVATDGADQIAEGLEIVPGIFIVTDVRDGKRRALIHKISGMAIVVGLKPAGLILAQYYLAHLDWQVSVNVLRSNPEYYGVIMELQDKLRRSRIQEERVATDFKGKRQPASGSRPGKKRDVVMNAGRLQADCSSIALMFELKTYTRSTCGVTLKDIDFLRKQAYTRGLVPAYGIELAGNEEIIIVPCADFPEVQAHTATPIEITEKSVPLNMASVTAILGGVVMKFSFAGYDYLIVSYAKLLQLVRGSECRQTDVSP